MSHHLLPPYHPHLRHHRVPPGPLPTSLFHLCYLLPAISIIATVTFWTLKWVLLLVLIFFYGLHLRIEAKGFIMASPSSYVWLCFQLLSGLSSFSPSLFCSCHTSVVHVLEQGNVSSSGPLGFLFPLLISTPTRHPPPSPNASSRSPFECHLIKVSVSPLPLCYFSVCHSSLSHGVWINLFAFCLPPLDFRIHEGSSQ